MDILRLEEAGCYICNMPCGIRTSVIFNGRISSASVIRPEGKKPIKYCADYIRGNELSCSSCYEAHGKHIEIDEVLPLL